jgi:tRNA threonylcarbamoyl adenosine modification protein (Sua5/YciO/YrdC/YwlC family)
MIEYINAGNIDDRVLHRTSDLLQRGGLVGLPTDTSWVIACSLNSKGGIKRLRRLSAERDERHFTLICGDISQIGDYCSMDNTRFRLIKRLTPGPYVFILHSLLGTEKVLDIRRREVGVRIPDHPVALELVRTLGSPLYSITAKKTMIHGNEGDSLFFEDEQGETENSNLLPPIPEEVLFEGGWELEDIDGLDLVLDPGEERPRIFSTILDLGSDEVTLVRPGAGPWPEG